MNARFKHACSLLILPILAVTAEGQGADYWIFEGLITETSTSLAPDLQSGWVLSGSFLLDPLELNAQFTEDNRHSGRMTGGITEGEMTVDLYHQVLFEAFQQPGLAGFDFQDNSIEEDGRDLFGWFFPLVGQLGETGWKSTWLQIWLMDPEGEMISHVPVKVSPYGIEWVSGWFRLTFADEDGNTAQADGRIELFCPESVAADQDASPWYKIASDLSRQLVQRDKTILLLESELTDVKERMEGLRRMVDLLVEERSDLQQDNALLREKAAFADPDTVQKLAELSAEKSLLESKILDLSGENENLQIELYQSENSREELLTRLRDLEKQASLRLVPVEPAVQDRQRFDDSQSHTGIVAQVQSPDAIEKPPATVPTVLAEDSPGPPSADLPDLGDEPTAVPARENFRPRRRGPRKFR